MRGANVTGSSTIGIPTPHDPDRGTSWVQKKATVIVGEAGRAATAHAESSR